MPTAKTYPSAKELKLAEEVLLGAPFAFVAMVEQAEPGGATLPYVVPMNFAYVPASAGDAAPGEPQLVPGRVFLHTGAGRKTQALADNPLVSMAVTAEEGFCQGASPCEDGFAFRSVLVEGRAILLEQPRERDQGLRAIVVKYDPRAVDDPFMDDALAETLVYAVEIRTLSYKERPRRS